MNANMKRTMLALAVATMFGTSMAYAADNEDKSANINHQHVVNDQRTHDNTVVNDTTNSLTTNNTVNNNYTANSNITVSDQENTNKETNNHSVDVAFWKHLGLTTDVTFSGNPTITGNINLDSAAIAIIDNRQSVSDNMAGSSCYDCGSYGYGFGNYLLTNSGSIGDNVGAKASGNIGMNVAAGDNNAQDNAAALSATDASFAFGSADAEVFVNQAGNNNNTSNWGVTNTASVSGNAFQNATGNIGVNVTSGNNNEQKNALAASVATTAFAQASVSSNQISNSNYVSNAGYSNPVGFSVGVSMSGGISGSAAYSGTNSQGAAYQMANFYPDNWPSATHPGTGRQLGHSDFDNQTQGATLNPMRTGQTDPATGQAIGGLAFDLSPTSSNGKIDYGTVNDPALAANLSGYVNTVTYVPMDATNTASLSGNAFENASGNIGVNVASGTGNLQANSLALAVAQPSPTPAPTPGG